MKRRSPVNALLVASPQGPDSPPITYAEASRLSGIPPQTLRWRVLASWPYSRLYAASPRAPSGRQNRSSGAPG